MPGPKMGRRPADFDEVLLRASPTMRKWSYLEKGQGLRYACRGFTKGKEGDEERLMRRILIARRNNIKDHNALKTARSMKRKADREMRQEKGGKSSLQKDAQSNDKKQNVKSHTEDDDPDKDKVQDEEKAENDAEMPATGPFSGLQKKRSTYSDEAVEEEMDIAAVEATPSYKAWLELPDGEWFVYNCYYKKGKEGHDWLVRKNIWRRMRYRRRNKTMLEDLQLGRKSESSSGCRAAAKTFSVGAVVAGTNTKQAPVPGKRTHAAPAANPSTNEQTQPSATENVVAVALAATQVTQQNPQQEEHQQQHSLPSITATQPALAAAAAAASASILGSNMAAAGEMPPNLVSKREGGSTNQLDTAAVAAAVAVAESYNAAVDQFEAASVMVNASANTLALNLAAAAAASNLDNSNAARPPNIFPPVPAPETGNTGTKPPEQQSNLDV